MKFRVKYVNDQDTITSVILVAANKFHLAELIQERITDMKNDDSDYILKVTEER